MIPRLVVASGPSSWSRSVAQVMLFLTVCIHRVRCADYVVGEGFTDTNAASGMNYTWTNTVDGLVRPDLLEANYQQWANSVNITVGDVLIFNFVRGAHTVFLASTELEYANCDFRAGSLETIPDSVPATYTVKPTDVKLYFTCTVPGHCAGGQKVKIVPFGTTRPSNPPPPATANAAHDQSQSLSAVTIVLLLFVCCITLFAQNHLYL